MEYVDPIKDIEKIQCIKKNLQQQSPRDLLLFVLGINTGIRISDLLSIKVGDIWDGQKPREFLCVEDGKSGDQKAFYINSSVEEALKSYLGNGNFKEDDYLFKSKKDNMPISRQQAYRIINQAAKEVGITGKIGTHTLRKTFGYHAYRKGIAISFLMSIFNHHTPSETLRYLGIDKNDEQLIKVDVNL
ncbi:site-specific integrase [Bacillus sp. FJAT-27251]|uniref:site-specific integrase n=1 Tax=Bacillus sp. FJAT-27251 TaxID=1684142 RepID=UPI0006A7CFDD|nr:site-specific integrase [Bacillus sp. FJAT-27251]